MERDIVTSSRLSPAHNAHAPGCPRCSAWIILALAGGQMRQVLTVDPSGAVTSQQR